jgi:hypothetical protein
VLGRQESVAANGAAAVCHAEAVAGLGEETAGRRKSRGENGFERNWTDGVLLLDQGPGG